VQPLDLAVNRLVSVLRSAELLGASATNVLLLRARGLDSQVLSQDPLTLEKFSLFDPELGRLLLELRQSLAQTEDLLEPPSRRPV
jgi:hypothetical protein